MTFSPPTQETLGAVLGRVASGVFVLTATDGAGHETGMLASWVQQASFDPPQVTVAVNKKRYLHDWLEKSPRMALHLVGENQKHLLKHFGNGFNPDEPAFVDQDVDRDSQGVPILKHALGCLIGNVTQHLDAGDHVIYLVNVTHGLHGHALMEHKPMVHLRKNGFHY